MPISLILSTIVVVGLAVHGWLAYTITGLLPGYAGSFYWFCVPHLCLLPVSTAFVIADAVRRKRTMFVAALICLSGLLLTWGFALFQWPGGDDGPGMAWAYGIGMATLLGIVIGLPLLTTARKLYQKPHNSGVQRIAEKADSG